MAAPTEYKLSTTTYNDVSSHDPTSALYPSGSIQAGSVRLPTGHPPKLPANTQDLVAYLGYVNVPSRRPPTHPGRMLLEEFLKPLGITQRQLADDICLPYRHVNGIVNCRRPVTPAIALRLTRYLGMSVGFWMNLQLAWDLYHAAQSETDALSRIEPLPRPDLPEPTADEANAG